MNLPARTWLPPNALADATLATLVSTHVQVWAARWLADWRDPTIGAESITQPTKIASTQLLIANDEQSLLVGGDDASRLKLGAAIIAAPAGVKPNSADGELYRTLADKALRDLGQDLAQLFSCNAPRRPRPGCEIDSVQRFSAVFPSGGAHLDIYVAQALALSARRARAQGARRGRPLGRITDAIGRQHISVGARVGSARIGLADLYTLGVGDVVVLDERHEDGVALTIDGVAADARACIEQNTSGLALRITPGEHITS